MISTIGPIATNGRTKKIDSYYAALIPTGTGMQIVSVEKYLHRHTVIMSTIIIFVYCSDYKI